jgi:isovaleryl-CoA dehydrogenase
MDASAACVVLEELCAVDPAFALSYLAHAILFVNNLNVNGSHEQKARLIPRAASGDIICGIAMSEAAAG